MTRFDSQYLQ